ncbi:MAG TPA: hypothetical protein VF469_08220 [Kofleriaceae bacterium]
MVMRGPGALVTGARVAALVAALVAAPGACAPPDYHCASDRDCDVGEAGRCELDHRCTAWDPLCPTRRRYSDHSGPSSNTCFDDQIAPANMCAAGQPPAPPTGCAASVCQALPSCCTSGWSEACVQQAQILCSDVVCDTRIAITANKPGKTELWDLRWDGTRWTARLDPRQTLLAWLAPLPGMQAPLLAGFSGGMLTFDSASIPVASIPVASTHNYLEATSVDFDRDGRPTVALGFSDSAGQKLEITKLDDGSSRVITSAAATRLSWGDVDHDAFPDGIAAAGGSTTYHLLSNVEADDHSRQIDARIMTTVTGGTSSMVTNDPPPVRRFGWIDFDGDHQLDAVAFGYSANVHLARGDALGANVLIRIDCDPPGNASATTCDATAQKAQAFAGASLPSPSGGSLLIATHPQRALYRATVSGTPPGTVLSPYTFPTEACGQACPPIIAVVVSDLDGDHQLDVIAIDGDLQVYTSLATDSLQMHPAIKLSAATPGFLLVRTSVTGAPR